MFNLKKKKKKATDQWLPTHILLYIFYIPELGNSDMCFILIVFIRLQDQSN